MKLSMFRWNLWNRQDCLWNELSLSERSKSRVAKSIGSLKTCDRISYGKERSERKSSNWKKIDIRKLFLKEGGFGMGIWPLWLGQGMVSDDMCANCALPYSMSDDILWIVLCRSLVSDDSVLYLFQRKVWRGVYKLSQDHRIVGLLKAAWAAFDVCKVFLCFLVKSWPLWIVFLKHPSVFIFFV